MANSTLSKCLSTFSPISLAEMDSVKLMNRIDTKYVVPLSVLPTLLQIAQDDYYAQQIDGKRMTTYDTLYYDTETLDMYMRHHDRQLVRQKIRVRHYIDTDETYLEIKRKDNKGRTKKKRILVPDGELDAQTIGHRKRGDISVEDFIAEKSRYAWSEIRPHLSTTFDRITLVNKAKTERLTIDTHLVWTNVITGESKSFPELVIIELKRDGNMPSPMAKILLEQRVKPLKISKYCIGTALTTPGLKQNRFKDKIRRIERTIGNR